MAASATSMKTKKTFGQWFKSRKVQQWLVIVSFMIVPVLLLLVFSYVPFAKMFEFSLYKMKSYDSKNNTYVGFKNYIDVFTRDDCFNRGIIYSAGNGIVFCNNSVLQGKRKLFI